MGASFLCKSETEKMNVCNALGVSSNYDGTPCPYPGSFYFEKHLKIPESLNQNLGSSKFHIIVSHSDDRSTIKLTKTKFLSLSVEWWITMYLNVQDCNEYSDYGFTCKTTFSAQSSDVTTHAAYAAGGAVLIGIVLYAAIADRKRRIAQINLGHEEQQADASGNFEMMFDTGVVA
jgi:hypothetical protein